MRFEALELYGFSLYEAQYTLIACCVVVPASNLAVDLTSVFYYSGTSRQVSCFPISNR